MATKTEPTTDEELRAQMQALRADLEKLTQLVVQSGGEHASSAVDGARAAATRVKDEAVDALETGREFSERNIESAETWIRDNPLIAVGCALGAGFLLAHLRSRQ